MYLTEIFPRYALMAEGDTISFTFRVQHKEGYWLWLECKVVVYLRLPDGSPFQVFGVMRDITERIRTEQELTHYRENLEEMVQARTLELEEKNKDLLEMQKLYVGREYRIKDLRDQVKELKEQLAEIKK
jgi:hypothetical protein